MDRKKFLATGMALMMFFVPSCSSGVAESNITPTQSSNVSIEGAARETVATKLVNRMTVEEKARVEEHALSLLDSEHPMSHRVQFVEMTSEDQLTELEESKEYYDEADYEEIRNYYLNTDLTSYQYAVIDGYVYSIGLGFDDINNLTEEIVLYDENGDQTTYENYLDYLEYMKEINRDQGFSDDVIYNVYDNGKILYDAVVNGNYEIIPYETVTWDNIEAHLPGNYWYLWEFDRDAVSAMADNIREYCIYDEEMNIEFMVHVVLPPDYDSSKVYPVFFMTDGVWRFGNTTDLYDLMKSGEAGSAILVTLGYYRENGTYDWTRMRDLILERDLLDDFITDNLMPYLCETYKIDCSQSTLYGHSNGGVFAHYALCNSDLYENQPFANYIIGSPAFWAVNNMNNDEYYCEFYPDTTDIEALLNDYGYLDRIESGEVSNGKRVFLCGGTDEDPDYADSYNGFDSTLTGLEKLKDRLENSGVDVTYKLYDSHHYQFIPDMLVETFKMFVPA